jgi:diadenosine tetraphosphate (Ap4A) HIT family hydrolase
MAMVLRDLSQAKAQGIAPWTELVSENSHVVVYRDAYAVTQGHLLFVPVNNTDENIVICMGAALIQGQQMVAAGECDAFNIGINMGKAAGQTVMYPHVHLIPRRTSDCADPTGGVRGVIHGQANYKSSSYQMPQ